MSHARNGLFVSILAKVGVQLVNLVGLGVLARMLLPDDFGLLAMVLAVVGLANLFKDLGLGLAVVRAVELSDDQVNSLFWVSSALGTVIAGIVYAAAPWVVQLYQEPRLLDITRVIALTFMLSGLATIPLALMRRRLDFGRLAIINVVMAAVTQLSGIALALHGFGYWALSVAMVLGTLASTLMALGACRMPIRRPSLRADLRPLLNYGSHVMIFGLLGFVALSAHNLILGIYHDAESVGLYHRAFMIMMLLMAQLSDPLGNVVTPVLARLQTDLASYRSHYLESLRLFMLFSAALSVLLYACAGEIVAILLGPGWERSVGLLQVFAIGLIPQALCVSTSWLYFSSGDVRALMWWGIGGWGSLIILLLLAAPGGMQALAQAYAAGMFILVLPCLKLALRRSALPLGEVLRASAPSVAAAIAGLAVLMLLEPMLSGMSPIFSLSLRVALFSVVYLPLSLVVFRQWRVLYILLPAART